MKKRTVVNVGFITEDGRQDETQLDIVNDIDLINLILDLRKEMDIKEILYVEETEECLKIYNKYKDDPTDVIARCYLEEYKDFTTHSVIISCTKYVTTSTTTTETVDILED